MSLPDRDFPSSGMRRIGVAAGLALVLAAAAGCTVRPLYGDVTTSATGVPSSATARKLASVEVKEAGDRVGQEVRNHLIFLLAGGAGQPRDPAYTLSLQTTARSSAAAVVQTTSTDLEPTSAVMTVTGRYRLTDAGGTAIAAGTRSAQAAYDVSRQGFAALRAQRDAQNRAARELAEQLRLAVAQDFERPSSSASPAVISAPEEVETVPETDGTENLPR